MSGMVFAEGASLQYPLQEPDGLVYSEDKTIRRGYCLVPESSSFVGIDSTRGRLTFPDSLIPDGLSVVDHMCVEFRGRPVASHVQITTERDFHLAQSIVSYEKAHEEIARVLQDWYTWKSERPESMMQDNRTIYPYFLCIIERYNYARQKVEYGVYGGRLVL